MVVAYCSVMAAIWSNVYDVNLINAYKLVVK